MSQDKEYPDYLNSFEELEQHIRSLLEGLSNADKGKRFAKFVQKLIPQSEVGSAFESPDLNNKVSNDGGVDLTAKGKNNDKILYVQSKLLVDRADTIDSVISKFQSFTTSGLKDQVDLFSQDDSSINFLLVTLSPISRILKNYEKQNFSSSKFYRQCHEENRIHFIDGHQILNLVKSTYKKLNKIPTDLVLNFETPYIKKDNVFIGILSSNEIKALYKKFGDALFFENVRDFLGVQRPTKNPSRTTPNVEIMKTVQTDPEKLLSRNNGLVFGAEKIEGNSDNQLTLHNGSVVNGCQTTMCIVEYADSPSSVLAKVVETQDAWDITKTANYQTSVPEIDLELARYMRPQLVKRAASILGVRIKDRTPSAFQLIDEFADQKVAYSETRLLYIGLFSRTPNNVFYAHYADLLGNLITGLYQDNVTEEQIFELLFLLQGVSHESLNDCKSAFADSSYAGIFERLYKDDSLSYRCFLGILALCGSIDINIEDREKDPDKEVKRIKDFLQKSLMILKNEKEKFIRFYKYAVKIWMSGTLSDDDDIKVRRDMHSTSQRTNFTNMYRKLFMEANLDLALKRN